jgi:hypothetical protein
VRIGQSLGLDLETTNHSPFETQIRRRVWYSIGILDLQAAFDTGSYSTLASSPVFRTPPPLHIDDCDILPPDSMLPLSRECFTDMTFCAATHQMLRYMRKMVHVSVDFDGNPVIIQTWAQRHAIVEECALVLEERYIKYCDPSITFQCFTIAVCQGMITVLRLLVRRPMYRFYTAKPPPNDDFNVLAVAADVLDQNLWKAKNHDFKPWEWFAWVKWYALAILLAELCEHTEGPHIENAWVIAEASFMKCKDTIKDDVLWRSLDKLMRKARSIKSLRFKTMDATSDQQANHTAYHKMLGFDADSPALQSKVNNGLDDADDTFWQEMEMMSWESWGSFVQGIGSSDFSGTTNGAQ